MILNSICKLGSKKREHSLCVSRGPTRKCRTNHRYRLHRTNHETVKLRRTTENTTGPRSDPVENDSQKKFSNY